MPVEQYKHEHALDTESLETKSMDAEQIQPADNDPDGSGPKPSV